MMICFLKCDAELMKRVQWRSSATKSGGAQIFKVKSKKKKKKKKKVTQVLN